MAQFPQILIKHNVGNTIEIPNQMDSRALTYLSDNYPIGSTSLDVDNAIDFSGVRVLASLNEAYEGASTSLYSGSNEGAGQAFKNLYVTTLKSCKFLLLKNGSPTGNAVAKLYLSTGTLGTDAKPTGSPLATSSNVDVSTLSASATLVEFSFPEGERYEMQSGVDYVITIEYSGGDVSNNISLKRSTDNTVVEGNASVLIGASWLVGSPPPDYIFYVYGGLGNKSILLLTGFGAENAEFAYPISRSDTNFSVLATKMPHNRGDLVQEVNYDQVAVYKSATIDGTYESIATYNLQPTQQKSIVYDLSGLTTDYYKVQWRNSVTLEVSSFSVPISVLAYPEDSVAEIIYPVLKAMGINENDTKINADFCISAIDDARKYVKAKLYGIRHAWNQKFEFPIKVLAGSNYVDLPEDIDFKETDRSTLAARFLIDNILTPFNLRYIDKRSWNQIAFSVMGGTTQATVAIAGTTITLDSAGDFPDVSSGVAYVATTDYDQEIMQIAYTGVNPLTNQLTGVTGVTREIPAGTRVWSNPTISQPIYYTVYENKLVFDRVIPDSMQGNNLYIDYYKKLEKVEDLYQELPEPYREIYKWYLKWAIKYRKDVDLPANDPDLKKFEDLVQSLFNNLYTGQESTIITS